MMGTTGGMAGRAGSKVVGAVLLIGATFLGGCGNALKDENSALMQENAELRERNSQLEGSLGSVESQRAALEGEVRSLRDELDTSRSGGGGRGTGFDDMGGVTVGTRGGEIFVGIAGDVLFDSGKATLKSSSKQTLDNVASVIKSRYPDKTIRVEGYTDTDPIRKSGWKTNERLSAERAMAVETYLVSKGLGNDQVYSAALGPARPKGSKKDSRRVEIVILDSTS